MSLAEQIQTDLVAAMKRRDSTATSTLRLLQTRIREAEVSGAAARTLSDDEIREVIARGVKERNEAIEAYTAAGRTESADNERAQREVLAAYLPAGLSDDEVAAIVARVVADGGFSSGADMGAAMRAVQSEVAGRADGRLVASLVKVALGI